MPHELFGGGDWGAGRDGEAGAGGDDVLDYVALGLGGAPAGADGDDVALAEGVGGVVDEIGFRVVEVLVVVKEGE